MTKSNSPQSLLIFSVFSMCLYGYGGHIGFIKDAHSATVTVTPMEGKALIVFVRAPSSDVTSLDYRRSPVFEITNSKSEPELVGILPVKTKIAYQIDPGKHLFMVVGEIAEFMTAEVLPNSTYYVLVLARLGNRAAIYSLKAIDKREQISKDFKELIDSSKWVENTPVSLNWASSNMASVRSAQSASYSRWAQRPESERPHLLPDDGTGGPAQPISGGSSGGAAVERPMSSAAADKSRSSEGVASPMRSTNQFQGGSGLVAVAEKAVVARPNDALAWRTLGDAHASSGDLTKAAKSYEEALRLTPGDSQTLASLASTYCGRYDRNQLSVVIEKTRATNPSLSEQIVRKCILP